MQLVLASVLIAVPSGDWAGVLFGGFAASLLALPAAGAIQVIVREAQEGERHTIG